MNKIVFCKKYMIISVAENCILGEIHDVKFDDLKKFAEKLVGRKIVLRKFEFDNKKHQWYLAYFSNGEKDEIQIWCIFTLVDWTSFPLIKNLRIVPKKTTMVKLKRRKFFKSSKKIRRIVSVISGNVIFA